MRDYSLHHVATRPAVVGGKLVTTKFQNTITRAACPRFAYELNKLAPDTSRPGSFPKMRYFPLLSSDLQSIPLCRATLIERTE
jgi:hypothetical protein